MNFDMRQLRVVLADDHTLVLEAFSNLISHEVDVVGTASDGRELIKVVKETNPDIVISDISMPVLNGLDAASKLLKTNPDLKIIFLTSRDEPDLAGEVFRAGAKGFLSKSSAITELLQAIQSVAAGATYVTPLVTEAMIGSLINGSKRDLADKLTVRQREVLQLLAEGNTMKATGKILFLTPRTVAFHKYRIMETLGIDSNAKLVRFAVDSGLIGA